MIDWLGHTPIPHNGVVGGGFIGNQATAKQLALIKRLKWQGDPPATKQEASWLIDELLDKKDGGSRVAERKKLDARMQKGWMKKSLRGNKEYVRGCVEMNRDYRSIAGYQITIGAACEGARMYDGAFLPIEVAQKHPQLLPPYKGICCKQTCECECDELDVNKRISRDMLMIIGPGRVKTSRRYRKLMARKKAAAVQRKALAAQPVRPQVPASLPVLPVVPYQQPAPVVVQQPPRRASNGLGTGGFVCGLLGLLLCWVPVVGISLAIIGLSLSSPGMSTRSSDQIRRPIGRAIAGLVLSVLATLVGVLLIIADVTSA